MAPTVQPTYYLTGSGPAIGDDVWLSNPNNHLLPNLVPLNIDIMQNNGMGNRFASQPGYKRLIYAHGALATVSFLVLVPAAVMVARFSSSRPYHHRTPALRLHVSLHLVAAALATAAFILGWMAVGSQRSLTNPHHGIGVALYVLLLVQAAIGCCCTRPRYNVRRSLLGSWTHQWLGRVTTLLGMSQVPLGLCLYGSTQVFFILYGVVTAVIVLLYVVLSYVYYDEDAPGPNAPNPAVSPRLPKGKPFAASRRNSGVDMKEKVATTYDVKATNTERRIPQQGEREETADSQTSTRKPEEHTSSSHIRDAGKGKVNIGGNDTGTPSRAKRAWQRAQEKGKSDMGVPTVHGVQSQKGPAGKPMTIPAIPVSLADEESLKADTEDSTGMATSSHRPEVLVDLPAANPNLDSVDTSIKKAAKSRPAKKKRRLGDKKTKSPPPPKAEEPAAPELPPSQLPSRLGSWDNIPEHYRLDGDETDVQSVSSYLWDAGSAHRRAFALGVSWGLPPPLGPRQPPAPPVNGNSTSIDTSEALKNETGSQPAASGTGSIGATTAPSVTPSTLLSKTPGPHLADSKVALNQIPGATSDIPRLRINRDTNIADTAATREPLPHNEQAANSHSFDVPTAPDMDVDWATSLGPTSTRSPASAVYSVHTGGGQELS
ncbi:hypothetical protein VTI74DRAFT_5391 [Chaetomium olivicolor]